MRRCLLEGLPELVKENVKLKEAIFELLKDIHTEMPNDPHVLMAISNCLCTYRKTHVKGLWSIPKPLVVVDNDHGDAAVAEVGIFDVTPSLFP